PAEKYSWRPAPGVRSVSEVFMHIALANFYLLSVTGPKMPPDMTSENLEKTVTKKADVIDWLKRSLAAVKTARAQLKPGDLERKVKTVLPSILTLRSGAQGQDRGQNGHRRWHVSADHHSR